MGSSQNAAAPKSVKACRTRLASAGPRSPGVSKAGEILHVTCDSGPYESSSPLISIGMEYLTTFRRSSST